MKSFVMTSLLAAMLAFEPPATSAQVRPGGPPGQRQQRQQLEMRLQQGFGRMVKLNLFIWLIFIAHNFCFIVRFLYYTIFFDFTQN